MRNIKEKFKIEYLFYIFLIISPFLDAFSFLYREIIPKASFSPITILRLIIPIILLIYIFFKDKKERGKLLLGGFCYLLYGIGHLYVYYKYQTLSAYGSVFHEAQYILNYTYMIMVFYFVYYFKSKDLLKDIYKYLTIFLWGVVFLLYLALLTNTSSSTYIDGIGYKGWNASGNAVGSILLISLVILLPYFVKEKKKIHIILLGITGYYLMFILGTRVGLLGFPLILFVYLICNLLYSRKFLKNKKAMITSFIVFILCSSLVVVFGSETLKRQKHLDEQNNAVIDKDTNEVSHITGDALAYVKLIEQDEMDSKFMDKAQQKSLIEMKRVADSINLDNKNRRIQQFLYHSYLIKNQHSFSRIFLGNGYNANYSEMTLEMELPAILYNFGILGFILYLGFFIVLEVKAIISYFKNIRKTDPSYLFYLFGVVLVYLLSLMAGYTFFHVSCMVLIIILHVLLNDKRGEVEK